MGRQTLPVPLLPMSPDFGGMPPSDTPLKRGRGRPPKKVQDGPLGTPQVFKDKEKLDRPKNPVGRPPGPKASLSAPKRVNTFVVIDSDEDKILEKEKVQVEGMQLDFQQQQQQQQPDQQQQKQIHQSPQPPQHPTQDDSGQQPMEGVESAPVAGPSVPAEQPQERPQKEHVEENDKGDDDPFAGVLNSYEAQVMYTVPQAEEKAKFESTRRKAEVGGSFTLRYS